MNKVVLAVASACVASSAFGQAKPLEGSVGVIGKPATLGKYQFALTGASFATRVVTKDEAFVAEKGKKFLILNYTVQNPTNAPLDFDWGQIKFTVVGADNNDYESANTALNPDNMMGVAAAIKPVQKLPVVTYIQVPANDPIPKLMVQSGNAPILRYDLKGKVKKAVGPYAMADGVTLKDEGAVKQGEKFELGTYDLVVEKAEDVLTNVGEVEVQEGRKMIAVTVSFTNATMTPQTLDWGIFPLSLKDANGEDIQFADVLVRAVGSGALQPTLKPGETVKGRYLFHADKEVKPATLRLAWGEDGRAILVSLK